MVARIAPGPLGLSNISGQCDRQGTSAVMAKPAKIAQTASMVLFSSRGVSAGHCGWLGVVGGGWGEKGRG